MAVAVVDALEAIDVDHQTGNGSAAALRSGQFLLQPFLQIAAVVPAGQEIGYSGSQKSRAVHGILEAHCRNRSQMRKKVGSVVPREPRGGPAAEAQRCGGTVLARQRQQRSALEIGASREQQMMIGAEDRK